MRCTGLRSMLRAVPRARAHDRSVPRELQPPSVQEALHRSPQAGFVDIAELVARAHDLLGEFQQCRQVVRRTSR